MKNATRILIPSLSLGLLVKTLVVSHALAFTLYTADQAPPVGTRNYTTVGAVTGANTTPGFAPYQSAMTLGDVHGGQGFAYSTPSVVKFGDTVTNALNNINTTAANSASFGGSGDPNANIAFTFALQNGSHDFDVDPTVSPDAYDQFVVRGYLTGPVGYDVNKVPNSSAHIIFTSITQVDPITGMALGTSVLTTNPNNGLPSDFINVTVGMGASAQNYDIFLNEIQDAAAPGGQTTSISGYIQTTGVPEPGSMALLLGLGVTGTALLRRRK